MRKRLDFCKKNDTYVRIITRLLTNNAKPQQLNEIKWPPYRKKIESLIFFSLNSFINTYQYKVSNELLAIILFINIKRDQSNLEFRYMIARNSRNHSFGGGSFEFEVYRVHSGDPERSGDNHGSVHTRLDPNVDVGFPLCTSVSGGAD